MKIYTRELAEKLQQKMATLNIWGIDESGWTFEVIATTSDLDRHGESLDINSWDIKNYLRNPIILFWHDAWKMENIVWKATSVEIINGQMVIKWVFAWENINPKAQMLRKLYDGWFIRTVSVWFKIWRKIDQNWERVETYELLELSFVPIPANPEAMRKAKELWAEEILEEEKQNEELEEVKTILKSLTQEVLEIKKLLVDGKTISEADKEKKENLQTAVRAINDVLRDMKQK